MASLRLTGCVVPVLQRNPDREMGCKTRGTQVRGWSDEALQCCGVAQIQRNSHAKSRQLTKIDCNQAATDGSGQQTRLGSCSMTLKGLCNIFKG